MRPESHQSVDAPNSPSAKPGAGGGALVRLGWMAIGPVLLVVSTFTIVATPRWTFGPSDVLVALGAVLSVGFRYWDIRTFAGETANGAPATMSTFRRYAVGVAIVVSACWVAAQSVHV